MSAVVLLVLLLIFGCILFWALAVVVEERFVPSLGVICETCKIPSDVAGATLMAAGASSPELFSSLVALFVTHSALGVGTVVGSEIFNHLMICAGSVAYARGTVLTLDRAIVARESVFYGLALVLLLVATGRERTPDGRHIVIHWDDGLVMLCVYVCYVLVCAKFESLVGISEEDAQQEQVEMLLREPSKNFKEEDEQVHSDHGGSYQSVNTSWVSEDELDGDDIAASEDTAEERNRRRSSFILDWNVQRLFRSSHDEDADMDLASGSADSLAAISKKSNDESQSHPHKTSALRKQLRPTLPFTPSVRRLSLPVKNLVHSLNLFGTHRELHDIETPPGRFACYLFRYNKFHALARFSPHTWDLRWISLLEDMNEFRTFRARDDEYTVDFWSREHGARKYKLLDVRELDKSRCLLQVSIAGKDQPKDYPATFTKIHTQVYLAPCPSVYDSFIHRAAGVIAMSDEEDQTKNEKSTLDRADTANLNSTDKRNRLQRRPSITAVITEFVEGDDGAYYDESNFIAWPDRHSTLLTKIFHVILFPEKLAFHLTIRSVQAIDNPSFSDATISCIQCVIWLAILSFCMCACCEKLGDIIGLSDATVGITFSAVGTSLPNLFASMTSARKGWGNAAVSNALGSNTFNILLGLGLPWFLYCLTHDGVYMELPADNVVLPICVLALVLAAFLLLLKFTQFTLYRIHAILFVFLYIAFLFWILTLPSSD